MSSENHYFGESFTALTFADLEISKTPEVQHCAQILKRLLGDRKEQIFPVAQNRSCLKGTGKELLVTVDVLDFTFAHYDHACHASYVNILAWGFFKAYCQRQFCERLKQAVEYAELQKPHSQPGFFIPLSCTQGADATSEDEKSDEDDDDEEFEVNCAQHSPVEVVTAASVVDEKKRLTFEAAAANFGAKIVYTAEGDPEVLTLSTRDEHKFVLWNSSDTIVNPIYTLVWVLSFCDSKHLVCKHPDDKEELVAFEEEDYRVVEMSCFCEEDDELKEVEVEEEKEMAKEQQGAAAAGEVLEQEEEQEEEEEQEAAADDWDALGDLGAGDGRPAEVEVEAEAEVEARPAPGPVAPVELGKAAPVDAGDGRPAEVEVEGRTLRKRARQEVEAEDGGTSNSTVTCESSDSPAGEGSNLTLVMPQNWVADIEANGMVLASVLGLNISAVEHDICVSGEWLVNFKNLQEEGEGRWDQCRWIGDVDKRSALGSALIEISSQLIRLPGWKDTSLRPEVMRSKKGGMSALITLPGADYQSPHDDDTEVSMILCLTDDYPLGVFPGSHMVDDAPESLVRCAKCTAIIFGKGFFHYGYAFPGPAWKTQPRLAARLGPNVRRGAHVYFKRFNEVVAYNKTDTTAEYAERRRSGRHPAARGVLYSELFLGGLAWLDAELVVLMDPVDDSTVEVSYLASGNVSEVKYEQLQSILTVYTPCPTGKLCTKLYGPKGGVLDSGVSNLFLYAGVEQLYSDRSTGLLCTGMPVLPLETSPDINLAAGTLRLGYILKTPNQLQGLVFLQVADEKGWTFQVFQAQLGNLVRNEKYMGLHPRNSKGSKGQSSSSWTALEEADVVSEKRDLEAFQYAFAAAIPVIIQQTQAFADMNFSKMGLGGKLGALVTKQLKNKVTAREVMTFTWSGDKEQFPVFPLQDEIKEKAKEEFKTSIRVAKSEAKKAAAKKVAAEKVAAEKVAKKAEEKEKESLRKAVEESRAAKKQAVAEGKKKVDSIALKERKEEATILHANTVQEQVQGAVKDLKLELAEASQRDHMQTIQQMRDQMAAQQKREAELIAESAEERGWKKATEKFATLLAKKDDDYKTDLREVFLGNNAMAKDALGKQSAQMGLMCNMFSQFTSMVAGRAYDGAGNRAAEQGMKACTAQLLRGDADQQFPLLTNDANGSPDQALALRKRKRQSVGEVRAFVRACNEDANKLFNLLNSKVKETVTEGETEVFIHEGIASGEIEPEEEGEGREKSLKILSILKDLQEQ